MDFSLHCIFCSQEKNSIIASATDYPKEPNRFKLVLNEIGYQTKPVPRIYKLWSRHIFRLGDPRMTFADLKTFPNWFKFFASMYLLSVEEHCISLRRSSENRIVLLLMLLSAADSHFSAKLPVKNSCIAS